MRLHENWELFSDALQAASQPLEEGGLGIKSIMLLYLNHDSVHISIK